MQRETEKFVIPPLETASDTVLYDIFYENGTILGGRLVALENKAEAEGDAALAEQWKLERRAMRREREAVGAFDRATQIACIRKWDARYVELRPVLYPEGEEARGAAAG